MEAKPDHLSPNFYVDLDIPQIEVLIQEDTTRVQDLKNQLDVLNNQFEISCLAAQSIDLTKKDV